MTVRRARTIDELYAEVADYDLVLTAEAPLSRALNRRLDRPHLGRFATTPRMLASGEFDPRDDRPLFHETIDRTDLDWKQASYLLETVLGCWEETGELRAILEYDRFDTPATRAVVAVLESTPSAHRDLATYTVPAGTDVAVVGEAGFTALDRQVLPDEYDAVSPFGDGQFDLPPFHVFDSRTDIVEALVDNVAPETAEEVAVVMDRGSAYPSLVESAFEASDIPFYGGPGFADDELVRAFLRLLRTAHTASGARVADVRPILARAGSTLPVSHDRKRVTELDHPDVEPLQTFCATVADRTFDEALTTFEGWCASSLDGLRDELRRLGLATSRVTEAAVDDLAFYLDSFDVPVDREDSGVLLADATAAAYVDRPVVFHLGMDVDWTHRVLDRPWIDAAAKDRQYLRQFQVLLQNGSEQHFLVQETSAGTDVTPCLYFHDLLDEPFDTFGDLPNVQHTGGVRDDDTGFERRPVGVEPTTVETLSQSSLATFVNCPRDYFFDRLVDHPDRDYFRKGTLYHDFAEFYASHPDVVDAADRDALVDAMVAELSPYVDDVDREALSTEFAVGLDLIASFLDENPPTERAYDGYEPGRGDNFVAEQFDRAVDSQVTERWFEDPDLGGKGKVDLVHAPTRLLDYKSGSGRSASRVVRRSSVDPVSDEPDFQALLYLAHHRRLRPDEELEFVFFHFLDLLDEAVTGDPDVDDALVRVSYYPVPFAEFVGRRGAFDALCAGVAESNDRRKTLERLGYDAYAAFFDGREFPAVAEKEELLETEFAAAFTDHARDAVGDYKYVRNGTDSALKRLLALRSRNYFVEDVDAFEAFLDEQLDRVNEYRRSSFPVGEPNDDRLNHPDLVRTDD